GGGPKTLILDVTLLISDFAIALFIYRILVFLQGAFYFYKILAKCPLKTKMEANCQENYRIINP
ncbi:MAG: hypothetical protein AAF485_07960, partial [Chloroflexota bacterium]